MSPPPPTDRDLLACVAAGDRVAFSVFVDRHASGTMRVIRATIRDPGAAEDALQETFLAVFRGAAGFRGDGSVRGWLYGMARRQALKRIRLRAGQPADMLPLDQLGGAAGWGSDPDPEAQVAAREDKARLQAALASLSPEDREVITLRELEQLSGPETAAALDITLPALKSRLHRARLRLLAALRDGGLHV